MKDLSRRILQIMEHYRLNKTEYAARLGVSPGVLSHISSGRNNPGLDMVVGLLESFPEVSPDWLIMGKGDMLRDNREAGLMTELNKLIDEVRLLNDMNYNSLNTRIDSLKKRISG